MLADAFNILFEWIRQNPHWAYLAVFLVAAGESLVVVGLFLPGVVLMFGFGALVAAGALGLGWTLLWAAAGAVAGDGVSFLIGRHFHQRLRLVWPFSRYGALIDRGIGFFHAHGGKSVLLARFIGPVRPILPAVAGMLDMPPRRFFVANILSALLWAPAYTLPGVVFGASLGLAAEVAGRLAVLVIVLFALAWFSVWALRSVIRTLQPRAGALLARALAWGREHPRLQPLTLALLDPAYPETRGLAALLALLAVVSLLLGWLSGGWSTGIDLFVHAGLDDLRTPVADRVLALVTGLGDSRVLLAGLAAGCGWLALRQCKQAALHWLTAGLTTLVLVRLLELTQGVPMPLDLFAGAFGRGTVSGHVALSIAVYGFLAVLVARELNLSRRWLAYACAALPVLGVAFSRMYLGANYLTDVVAGAGVGLACVALLGIAYRRHPAHAVGWPALILVAAAGVIGAGGWWVEVHHPRELARRGQMQALEAIAAERWRESEWRSLAVRRRDFLVRRQQALNLQYAGELRSLEAQLVARGWRTPRELTAANALLWLSPKAGADALPVMPQVHNGVHNATQLVRAAPDGRVMLLRVWPTKWLIDPGGTRIWVGSVTEMEMHRRWRLFSYLVTGVATPAAIDALQRDLDAGCAVGVRERDEGGGNVLLASDCHAP